MPTGYVFEEIFTRHSLSGHPENPGRLLAIMDYLNQHEILSKLTQISSRPARREELVRCHHPGYIELV